MKAIRSKITGALVLTTLVFGGASAGARTLTGWAGHAYHGSEQNCFTDTNTGAQDTSGGTRWFVIPLSFDTFGTKTITVRGSTSGVSCYYWGITAGGSAVGSGVALPMNTATGVSIGAGEMGEVQCSMTLNTIINGVDYTP